MAGSEIPHRVMPPQEGLATRAPFPVNPEDFGKDERVSYSKRDSKWILEDAFDNTEWEFHEGLNKWIPSLDEALLERQQQAYAIAGVDERHPVQPFRKRKSTEDGEDSKIQHKKGRNNDKSKSERKNTAVYITSIPLDATLDEIAAVFSKYGVIADGIDTGKPRVKLYMDENGKFKGDALVVYFRPESVHLAIQMLDETDFRLGEEGPTGKMRVREADSSYKKQKAVPDNATKREKKKVIRRTQHLNNKLADWSDDEPSALPGTSSRWDKIVVLKHMFTLGELEEDPAAVLDIKEDIRDECAKLGEVTNVVLFDKEPDGVVTVRFRNPESAKACIRLMDGRHFGGQQVEASLANGTEKFKKTRKDAEDDDDESDRMHQFGEWLENKTKVDSAEA